MLTPDSAEELAAQLAEANSRSQTIRLSGNSTKERMGGPIAPADVSISTAGMNRVLEYEPRDLTISVEAGVTYRELSGLLAENRQMIPLDPSFSDRATIGGIVAANISGPRRRLYGTARDMVIGMTFATLEGKLVRTGGMVVKNVAGLDMGKLMIGSFGTLAAIVVVNFKLHPMVAGTRTFIQEFGNVTDAIAARDGVLQSVLQPAAMDIVKTAGGYQLLIQAGGSAAVLDRYSRELEGRAVEGAEEQALWENIREFTPRFLVEHETGMVVRVSCSLSEVGRVLESLPAPAVARAGSGVCYGYFEQGGEAAPPSISPSLALGVAGVGSINPPQCPQRGGVIEFAPQSFRERAELWPEPGTDFAMMKEIKKMFDPLNLLNRGRLYGRI